MVVDAHQHFWRYRQEDYGWIGEGMEILARDFLPEDLRKEMVACGVEGTVAVQARQTVEETEWLLELAQKNDFIRGVVGWVPLVAEDVGAVLEKLTADPLLRGVRHVLQDEPDDDFMLGDAFNRGLSLLRKFNLSYDILIFERHLETAMELVDRHPEQRFIVDHLAKPSLKRGDAARWRRELTELAHRENVACKVSGLVTEADWATWTPEQLHPFLQTALNAFGPERLMFGSDWPVCLLASGYARWKQVVEREFAEMLPDERGNLFGGNARQWYQLR